MNHDEVLAGLREYHDFCAAIGPLVERIERPQTKWDRFAALREYYKITTPEILKHPANVWALDPYQVNWGVVFTPIEYGLWCDIRGQGAVLYPQYPIGRYFADFANPVARVVVECDGAAYHQDARKDHIRQCDIEQMGWAVYRITGRACIEPDSCDYDEHGNEVFKPTEAYEFLAQIASEHGFGRRRANKGDDE